MHAFDIISLTNFSPRKTTLRYSFPGRSVTLESSEESNPLWTGVVKSFRQQNFFDVAGKQFMQGIARALGWFVLDGVLYGGDGLVRSIG